MRLVPLFSMCLLLVGCPADTKDTSKVDDSDQTHDSVVSGTDADADGVTVENGDCDDADAEVYPGNTEVCDGKDNNCNTQVDEGLPDADGNGTPDCRDTEICDGFDNDGDGQIDEDFADSNGDGVADCLGTEVCNGVDDDGDGDIDEGYDADGDGYTQCGDVNGDYADCDDSDAAIHPSAHEVDGDGIDNDCDGIIDEGAWAYGDLTITEVMNNPSAESDPDGEWFEVYNTTTRTLTLNGLTIMSDTGELHQVSSTDLLQVEPGEFFVFGINKAKSTNGDVSVGYEYSDVSLSNESDSLSVWADDVMLDELTWDDGATMPDPNGASMMIDEATYGADENDDANRWCYSIYTWSETNSDDGTPGADNGVCPSWDHDGDGISGLDGDCDDTDPAVYPGAPETDYSKDYNCDGMSNLTPTAVATTLGPAETCSALQLIGDGSSDPEGASLTYTWELVSAPAGSALTTSDLSSSSAADPTINPDLGGDYTFQLTVSDGYVSDTDTLTVTVAERPGNFPPTANAGADQSYSSSVTCTPISYGVSYECADCTTSYYFYLDASSSSDPNGDQLTYSWAITSGATYGTLTVTGDATAQVLMDDAPATYGTATNTDVVVELTATDCMGATSTDDVTLTYACTGS